MLTLEPFCILREGQWFHIKWFSRFTALKYLCNRVLLLSQMKKLKTTTIRAIFYCLAHRLVAGVIYLFAAAHTRPCLYNFFFLRLPKKLELTETRKTVRFDEWMMCLFVQRRRACGCYNKGRCGDSRAILSAVRHYTVSLSRC